MEIYPPARVCGPRNGNRSSSILAVASRHRYTLQWSAVGGPPPVRSRFAADPDSGTNRRRWTFFLPTCRALPLYLGSLCSISKELREF